MAGEVRNFDAPDETRPAGQGTVEIVSVGGSAVGRTRFEPGWRWSSDVKPIVGTDSCQAEHLGYAVSGTIHVITEDGSEIDISSGDVYAIQPGHDAWVVGDEAFVGVEFQGKTAQSFAKA